MSRYDDLVSALRARRPETYRHGGDLLPLRDGPTSIVFQTGVVGRVYGVFDNNVFAGTCTSDSLGAATANLRLGLGTHVIVLEDDITAARYTTAVTVANLGTGYAALSDVLEAWDDEVEALYAARGLSTVDSRYIESVYGRPLETLNDLGLSLSGYRNQLQWMRQNYRHFAAHPAGLAGNVGALVSTEPLVIPDAWKSKWVLGQSLIDNANLQTRSLTAAAIYADAGTSTELVNLNQLSRTAVHAAYGAATLAFPGPITLLPSNQRLTVTFSGTWDRGNVTVTGVLASGETATETFTASAGNTVSGVNTFVSVTSIAHTAAGTAGTASVGLADSRFVRVLSVGGGNTLAARALAFTDASTDTLRWGGAAAAQRVEVPIPVSGTYTILDDRRAAYLVGLVTDTAGSFTFTAAAQRMYLSVDGGPIVEVRFGVGALTNANTRAAVNNALAANGYSASYATFANVYNANRIRLRDPASPVVYGPSSRIDILPHALEASTLVFGVPTTSSTLTGAYSAGTPLPLTSTASFPTTRFTARVGRTGIRQSGTGVQLSAAAGGVATITLTGAVMIPPDFNGYVVVSGMTTGTNDGTHQLVAGTAGSNVGTVIHETASTGSTFTNQTTGGAAWAIYSFGETVDVLSNDRGTNTLTLANVLTPATYVTTYPAGARVEMAEETPWTVTGSEGLGSITVEVDRTYVPTGNQSDNVTPAGSLIGDGWIPINAPTVTRTEPARYTPDRLTLQVSASGAPAIWRPILSGRTADFAGWRLRATFAVENHAATAQNFRIDYSMDGGSSWTNGSNTSVASTPFEAPTGDARGHSPLSTSLISQEFEVTWDATSVAVRVTYTNATATDRCSIEGGWVVAMAAPATTTLPMLPSLFLGASTVPTSNGRDKFGEVVYVWPAEDIRGLAAGTLTLAQQTQMRALLGLPTYGSGSTPTTPGHVDFSTTAHGIWERFDLSEWAETTSSVEDNLLGAYNDVQLAACTLTNLTVRPDTPAGLSFVEPTRPNIITDEVLTFSTTAPFVATTLTNSDHTGAFPQDPSASEVMIAVDTSLRVGDTDGLVVPQTEWRWDAVNQVRNSSPVYNGNYRYYLRYFAPIQLTTPVIDLGSELGGTAWDDYLWLADATYFIRREPRIASTTTTEEVQFLGDLTASISSQAQLTTPELCVLVKDDGIVQTTLALSDWAFVDKTRIKLINSNLFDANSVYSFTYPANHLALDAKATVTLEIRSAAASVDVAAATYAAVRRNQVIDLARDTAGAGTLRYHQLRLTLTGLAETGDARIYGLGLKGIRQRATTPYAPGIIYPGTT